MQSHPGAFRKFRTIYEKLPMHYVMKTNLRELNHVLEFQIEEDESWWENVDLTKLILASNQLTRISGDIKNLPCLTVLDVHDNRIEELPDEIGLLEQLSK